jgi:hypothetical protein
MNDITGKKLQKGDLFISAIQNRLHYGIVKRATQHSTLHFYMVKEYGLNKLKYDVGIREIVPITHWGHTDGMCVGQGYVIDFIKQNSDRVLLITDKQIPDLLQGVYKEMRKYI